ncbi:MAG: energy-coupling factor transport system substrate-specific component [Solirubrobacteraceae bacterium]|nr:energy-coupling factor transport system substrate-specific component [Solirubrobacteraceae bacterium]
MSWALAATLLLGLALAAGFAWWERSHPPSRLLALVATLAALAALGRVAFAPLPNVKPTTDIVLFAGFALGAAPGFMVGAIAALASNLFFGQGPWTPWQMAAWGAVGLFGAVLAVLWRGRTPGRVPLALACGVAGYGFGTVMNVSLWVTYGGDHTLAKLLAYQGTSLPFDLAHVAGNVLFCLAFGPALIAALARFRARLDVRWIPVAAGLAGTLVVVGATPSPDAQAAGTAKPVSYLRGAQNADGGFGGAPGQSSSGLYTGWTALGLAAAGHNPADVKRGGTSVLGYLEAHVKDVSDLGELERTILVLTASGQSPRTFGGRDLVAEVLRKQAPGGAFAARVNTTAFAVLALRAAGRPATARPVRRAVAWIAGQANPDGGYNFAGKGGPSGVDDTGAAVQALVAGGRRGTRVVQRAVRFILRRQQPDGGFPLATGGASNAQSTAWAMQALIAAGRKVADVRRGGSRSPDAYLRSLTGADGAVRYSRTSKQTPVWVTGQALTALAGKPFPLARVARAAHAARPTAARPAPTARPAPRSTAAPTPAPTTAPESRRSAISDAELEAAARRAGTAAGLLTPLVL